MTAPFDGRRRSAPRARASFSSSFAQLFLAQTATPSASPSPASRLRPILLPETSLTGSAADVPLVDEPDGEGAADVGRETVADEVGLGSNRQLSSEELTDEVKREGTHSIRPVALPTEPFLANASVVPDSSVHFRPSMMWPMKSGSWHETELNTMSALKDEFKCEPPQGSGGRQKEERTRHVALVWPSEV
jgi:hypothetical protein